MEQLSQEYDICDENVTRMLHILGAKRGAVADLESAHTDAEQRLEEAEAARDHRNKVSGLKEELAWARANAKENELAAQLEVTAKVEHHTERLQEKLDTARQGVDAAAVVIVEKESIHAELGDEKNGRAQETALRARLSALRKTSEDLKVSVFSAR